LDALLMITYLIAMLLYEPTLTGVVIALAVAQLTLAVLSVRLVKPLVDREVYAQAASHGYLVEVFRSVHTIKASAAEDQVLSHWGDLFNRELNASMVRQGRAAQMNALVSMISVLGPAILLVVGARLVVGGAMSLGAMLAFNALAGSFLAPLGTVVAGIQGFQTARTHLDRLNEVYDHGTEQPLEQPRSKPAKLTGGVSLENVAFRYGRHDPLVVADVTLRIRPGAMVAITGRSGAGKSTLLSLISGLYDPTVGRIVLDSEDPNDIDVRAVRRRLGIVLQESTLFGGTVRRNISLVDPGMSLDRVRRAARLAEIDEFIQGLPMGYETPLAEMAGNLSGGQRQRLCLARALAHEPDVLILDEATSELDAETEARILKNLERLPCTRVVAAHRFSAIRTADVIVVLDKGRVMEMGSHKDLLRLNGEYAALVQWQGAPEGKDDECSTGVAWGP
ncbi:MAG: peptidase domain-containing ABC transporter, partial [Acidobacteria bacterium]|nr:peptidase domain-containing ABC transporter [Acidobacteriota bacterium]